MYLPLSTTTAIFIGGLVRWLADKARGVSASETETETSPGVLLGSGYIAGGTLVGLVIAFFVFLPKAFNDTLDIGQHLGSQYTAEGVPAPKIAALVAFAVLAAILFAVGRTKTPVANGEAASETPR
jgi:hypothetical protein